jgi:hypothetical protein
MRRFIVAAAVVLVVVGVVVVVTPAEDGMQALGDDLFGKGLPATPIAIVPPEAMQAPELPTLTDEEIAKAKEILANDPHTPMLPDGWYIEEPIMVWVDSQYEKIGAAISIKLREPVPPAAVKGSWPILVPDASAAGGYRHETREITQERIDRDFADHEVLGFMVSVDLQRAEVVQFDPLIGPQPGVTGHNPPGVVPTLDPRD